jgi:YHS domain-containing protein
MTASSLADFSQRIGALLVASSREPQLSEPEVGRYMQDWVQQRQKYETVAARITDEVIRPRMELLPKYLPHARLTRNGGGAHCTCWIAYSPRFPASMKIEFTIEPDSSLQQAVVRSELFLVPAFMRYDAHDKFVVRLDSADDAALAHWVEDRVIAALEAYLRLDRGSEDADDEPVVDPVCGMRLRRSSAAAQMDYRGHPYFFCAEACQRRFAAAPEQFVRVVME